MPATPPEDLQTPTLAQVMQTAIEARLVDVHTTSWGTVMSYDAPSQTAVIQLIQRRAYIDGDGDRASERPAPLVGVPVQFPGSGGSSITWGINPGDVVLVLFLERDMSAWYAGGEDNVDSGDDRMHSLSDAVAIPGLRPATAPIATPPQNALVVTVPDDQEIRLGSKNANKVPALNDDVAAIVGAATALSSVDFNSFKTNMQTAFPSAPGVLPAGARKLKVES